MLSNVKTWLWVGLLGVGWACRGGGDGGGAREGTPVARGEAGDVAIVGATVVPMDREGVLAEHTVLVRAGRIAAVAPATAVDVGAATVVDGTGKWLVPGLADMHVHIQEEGDLSLFLLNGVTTVRDLYGSPRHLRWRETIARGELDGPTLLTSGAIIDGDPPTWPGSSVVKTAEEARAEVRAQKQAGYDWIKVYNSLGADAYQAIVSEARAQGLPVGGHVPKAVGVDGVLAAGQRSIEHADGYVPFLGEPKVDDAVVAATVKAGTWLVPTFTVTDRFGKLDDPASLSGTRGLEHVSAAVRDRWNPQNDFRLKRFTPEMFAEVRRRNDIRRDLVGRLSRAGGRIALGTDTGNPYVVPGFAVHEELRLLVAAGLSPWQALHAGTASAAELAGAAGAFGVVAVGARADLLLVDRDPLADVAALVDPPVVLVRGVVRKRDELVALVGRTRTSKAADRAASLPPLVEEGEGAVAASYDALLNGTPIGVERARASRVKGERVVRGHMLYEGAPVTYRATPSTLELDGEDLPGKAIRVARKGKVVVATPGKGDPVQHEAPADAIVAPQAVSEFVFYGDTLASLGVGATRKLEAVEVMTDTGLKMHAGRFTFTRKADEGGRRVYDMAGTHGPLDLKGTFSIDPDGLPSSVELTLKFGVFSMRRVP